MLAKPNGITLADHTRHVRDEAAQLLAARPFIVQKYQKLTAKDLSERLDFCARWHDEGKAHPKWQNACVADFKEWQANPKARGKNLMKSGIRHEMDSLVRLKRSGELYTKSDLVAIGAHHAKLSRRAEKRWNDDSNFASFWADFLRWSGDFRLNDPASFEAAVAKRYLFDGPRAMLQLADHRASAREEGEELPLLAPFVYKFPHPKKRGVQAIIEELWDEPLAILRAPTGAGKTDAALLWAQHQFERERADRLVIAMPTRFTSNALAIGAAENLSAVGVYHSTSYFNRKKREPDESSDWIRKENDLARLIETPVCVTTLDHLCIALTGAREDHHSIFWGLSHSCVVIDEADFYDEFTQYNLVTLLRALKVLKVPVLVMSATVPDSSLQLYALAGTSISKIYEDKSDLSRVRCEVHLHGDSSNYEVETPDDIAQLLNRALDGEPTIIYANTVKRAQTYCDWLQAHNFEDFVLYHSRFTEPDKARKEEQLISMLGKEAWENGFQRGVAVLTQIGELSVNISADLMISDFCPLDRLAQRAGRLARFGLQKGELHVVTPIRADKTGGRSFYPAPYGEFRGKEGWISSAQLEQSRAWLKAGDKSAQDWIDGVNVIYGELQTPSGRTKTNQDKLEKLLITNWMIVQAAEIGEDDDGTKDWKSRDIPLQKKVYVSKTSNSILSDDDEFFFRSWRGFREWETETAISVLSYEVALGVKNGALQKTTIFVGEDEEVIFLANKNAYSFERGLILAPQQDEAEEEYNPHDDD